MIVAETVALYAISCLLASGQALSREKEEERQEILDLVFVVQSVPSRAELRQRLLEYIPPAIVVEDVGPPPPSPWAGYQLCLRRFLETGVSHACILQDDVVVCRNFVAAVVRITEVQPDVPVCLFVSGRRSHTLKYYRRAAAAKQAYSKIWFQDFLPVVAVLWPRVKVEEFLDWAKDAKLPGMPNPRSDDAVAGSWMKFTKQTVLATVPSLVEHPDDTPSVKWSVDSRVPSGHKNKRNRACWFIGDDDPLELDWSV